jgi:hypothetical protein
MSGQFPTALNSLSMQSRVTDLYFTTRFQLFVSTTILIDSA